MFKNLPEIRSLMIAQLADSGLTVKDCPHYKPLTADAAAKLGIQYPAAGYVIPYRDRTGKPTKFWRFRYLEKVLGAFGEDLGFRYVQPTGVLPQVYWSPLCPWDKVLADKTQPIYITEGEKKADCACKNLIPTIGLGGVWSFKSKKVGLDLLRELDEIDWKDRLVYIVFDSDALSNPNVVAAEVELGRQLLQRSAHVFTTRFPHDPFRKVGLDDFLVSEGPEAFLKLDSEEFASSQALHDLNLEVSYIQKPSGIIKLEDNHVMRCVEFVNEAFVNRSHMNTDGKMLPTAKAWMRWGGRNVVKSLTYKPNQPKITSDNEYNRWQGWGVEPKEGDVRLWTELLDFLCKDAGQDVRVWFEQWLAYPLQYPGAKLFSAVAMWSYTQRVGKSLVGYTMQKIYGQNFHEIGSDDLIGNFNPWAKDKQFIMADEVATAEESRKTVYNRLKRWITQAEVTINTKYSPVYTLPDCTNYYFNSNGEDMFYVAKEDARLLVIEVEGAPLPKAFYNQFLRRRDKEGGAGSIFHHLLNLPMTGFDPSGPPPITQAKRNMQDVSLSAAEKYVDALKNAPEEMLINLTLHKGPYKLYTISELVGIAHSHASSDGECKYITPESLGKALRRYGFKKVCTKDGIGRIRIPGQGFPYVWNFGVKVTTAEQIRDFYHEERIKKEVKK